jgi:hypothetical protein
VSAHQRPKGYGPPRFVLAKCRGVAIGSESRQPVTLDPEADIKAGLKLYNVTLREADAVFLNTGWNDLFKQYPAQNATYNGSEPGIKVGSGMAGEPEGGPRGRRYLGGRGDPG